MAYGFPYAPAPNVDALMPRLTPEEIQRQALNDAYERGSQGGGMVGGIMGSLSALRDLVPQQAPTPRTLSGGDVVGLLPEQYNKLADRVQQQNIIDQQAYTSQQNQLRDEQLVREGRVMSLRDANARRQADINLENMRLEQRAQAERELQMTPKITSLGDGYVLETAYDEAGTPSTKVYQAAGADKMPGDQKLITTYDEQGNAVRTVDAPGVNVGQKPPTPVTPQQRSSVLSDFLGMEVLNNETGKYEPVDLQFADTLTDGYFANNGRLVFPPGQDLKIRKAKGSDSSTQIVTHEDGSKTLEPKEEGMQTQPPSNKDPFVYLQKTFGVKWAEGDKQTMANALAAAGFNAEQTEQALGKQKTEGYIWDKENYTIPTAPAAAAPVPTGATPAANPNKPVERTLKDGTKVMVQLQPDGTWAEVSK
jgi:hypothetical protein